MKKRLWNITSRLALGLLSGYLIASPQAAIAANDLNDDYDIYISGISDPASPFGDLSGTGGFGDFNNPGTPGGQVTESANNLTVTVTGVWFKNSYKTVVFSGDLFAVVKAVDYNDGKTGAEHGANQITGDYVEGLQGTLLPTSSKFEGLELEFKFSGSGGDPAGFVKDCLIKDNGTPVTSSCDYHVQNIATIPEPGTLALLGLGLAAAAATRRRQRRRPAVRNYQ